ncbi:MAG: helix-turn-helix domain-containing protein [Faecalibacillus sp.]
MATEVTSRMKQISELILKEKNMTLENISSTLHISLRQVRYDLERINEFFDNPVIPVLETDNKGKIIVNDKKKLQTIKNSNEKNFKFSQKQRLYLLMIICAFNIERLNLSQLSKEINTSRMTIKNDINTLKNYLKQYHLELVYKNHFHLLGDKKNLYRLQQDVLYLIEYTLYKDEFEKYESLMQDYMIEKFNHIPTRQILPIIQRFLDKNHQSITDSQIYWFACNIILDIWYDKNHLPLPIDIEEDHQMQINFQSLFDEIEVLFDFKISNKSQKQIKSYYSAICQEKDHKQTMNMKVIKFIYGLMTYIKKHYTYDFVVDSFFLNSLYYHIERSYRLLEINTEIPHLEKYYTQLDPYLSSLITKYCQENTINGIYLEKEDIDFIKLYFANLFYRKNEESKKILLICGASKNLKEQLCLQLETMFNLKVIKTISKYELPFFDEWKNIDILLFTEEIPSYFRKDIPMETINIHLSFEDYLKLNQLDIVPKTHTIDFNRLYKDLNFLDDKNKIKTFKVLYQYLSRIYFSQSSPLLFSQHHIETIDYYNKDQYEIIPINAHYELAFQYGENENTQVYISSQTYKITFIITSYEPAKMIQLLLGYARLESVELWKYKDKEKILTAIQSFFK